MLSLFGSPALAGHLRRVGCVVPTFLDSMILLRVVLLSMYFLFLRLPRSSGFVACVFGWIGKFFGSSIQCDLEVPVIFFSGFFC